MPTRLAGYASVFDVPDAGGDVVRKGAFARLPGHPVPLLWQHDAAHPIGTVDHLSEDARGLRVIASLADTRTARDAAALVKSKALTGLSFGYRVRAGSKASGGLRHLTDLELIEVSLVTFPMQRLARVVAVSPEETPA
ncbi:MAG: HK97 family phage prohead protease [Sphingomonadaceae bacterium]|nr:HK97 family phage prohead protease [Sphingomonadaceae bacterium]